MRYSFFNSIRARIAVTFAFWATLVFVDDSLVAQQDQLQISPQHSAEMKAGLELFDNRIRGLLNEHCLQCHGGDSTEGDFNLATRESLLASGLVKADEEDGSYLLRVIRHESEPHMPQDAERLPDEAIADIAQWLAWGAPYSAPLVDQPEAALTARDSGVSEEERQFWAFRPLSPLAPPPVTTPSANSWVRTPIDQFIVEKLSALNISPNAITDRRRLIRRACFDLIGLPPSPEEVDTFVNDPDPQAYEKLVDRLLQSPHYGERWARHWMDIARFAESHGYEQDYDRPTAYHYRDFLIRALNSDLPYDQFVRWQIAGDELAPEEPLAMMATGFLGAGAFPTQLTEAEFESSRYDELDDMINTMGTAILGLSVGCARCHTHKFDPISLNDYYRLAANFALAIRSEVELDLDPVQSEHNRLQHEADLAAARHALEAYERDDLPDAMRQWLQTWKPNPEVALGPWQNVAIRSFHSASGTQLEHQSDDSWLARGDSPAKDTYTFSMVLPPGKWRALRLECLTDNSLPHRGPGRAGNGNFAMGDIYLRVSSPSNQSPQQMRFVRAQATHQQNGDSLSASASIDNDLISGWAVDHGGIGRDQAAVFELALPIEVTDEQAIDVVMEFQHPNGAHIPGRVRLSWSPLSDQPPSVGVATVDPRLQDALLRLRESWVPQGPDFELAKAWLSNQVAGYQSLQEKLIALEKLGPKSERKKVLVTAEGYPHLPHHADDRGFPHFYSETFVLTRGDVKQKRAPATPGFLPVLMRNGKDESYWQIAPRDATQRSSMRRAALAEWLMDTNHGAGHLAARVIVNRLWQHHFGQGIVATSSDFGNQGAQPTHPELLDWLAVDLIQNGWQLKRMHRLMMTSAVYMQASEPQGYFAADQSEDQLTSPPEQYSLDRESIDRENKYLWKFPIRRLEAEAVRDALLAVSGQLDPTPYGPGSLDQSMKRRSIYFFIKRSQLIPMMMLLDWPEHQVGIGQRATTTIAPQALAFMNSPQVRSYAASFAGRLQGDNPSERIVSAYKIAFGRAPLAEEQDLARRFLQQQADVYQDKSEANAEATAWTDFCQVLMSMNEMIYVD